MICTDYRVINNIAIKYRNLIIGLYDLLDELFGAFLFSKVYGKMYIIKLECGKWVNEKLLLK